MARTRGARFLGAWAVLTIATAFGARACLGQHVLVDSLLAVRLDRLAHDSVEHAACLYGTTQPNTVVLYQLQLPPQQPIGTYNVVSDWEPCVAALAHWHNHPVPRDSAPSARDYLYYSITDEHTFIRYSQALVAFVAIPGEWCMWTRMQVKEGLDKNLTPLPRVEGQCVTVPAPP